MFVEDVRWSQQGDHVEEGVLVDMDKCWGREGSRKEMKSRSRGAGVETLESLEGKHSVNRQNSHVRRGEQERGQATE